MHKLIMWPSNKSLQIDENSTLLEIFHKEGVTIRSSCGGYATCGECIVKVVGGEDNLVPPAYDELKLLGNTFHITKERLACQCRVRGDVTVDCNSHSEALSVSPSKSRLKPKILVKKKSDMVVDIPEETEEKPMTPAIPLKKKLGGGKRPRFFDTDKKRS